MRHTLMIAAVLAVAAPAVSQAQNATADTTYPANQNDDDEFPWGLLGLLGLVGLAGLKRRDNHVHVDSTTRR